MTWPTDDIETTDLDAATDTPPRPMFKRIADRLQSVIGARGQANGVAALDADGHVPDAQLGGVNVASGLARLDSTNHLPSAHLRVATESVRGGVELASAAEAAALSRTDRAVSPANLPDATTTQRGIVAMANAASARAGDDPARAVSSASLKAAMGFSRTVWWDGLTFRRDGTRTLSLSTLTRPPRLARFWLRCAAAEHGYAVGDRVFAAPGLVHNNLSGTDAIYGFVFTVNAGDASLHLRIAKDGIRLLPKTTGNSQGVVATDSRWRMEVQVWG